MNKPNLFDVVELTVDWPEENLARGAQGTVVECYADGAYEVEFTDDDGQTLTLCAVSPEQIRVAYRHQVGADKEKIVQKLLAIVNSLDKEKTEEVLDFANSLCQRQAVTMKKLKGSGNGNLVTALLAEREEDALQAEEETKLKC